jgi:hypothetical protein
MDILNNSLQLEFVSNSGTVHWWRLWHNILIMGG